MRAARTILRETGDLLNKHGWCQGTLRRGRSMCVLGAIGEAARSYREIIHAQRLLAMRIHRPIGDAAAWNDEPGQTAEHVIRVLRGKQ